MQKIYRSRALVVLFILICCSFYSQAQIAAFNNSTLTGTTAGSINATTNDANLNTVVLSRGPGIVASSLNGGYASNNWNVPTQAEAITNSKYYECTLSAKATYKVSLSTLDFKLRRSSSGPNAFIWRYSLDGTTFTDIGSAVSFTSTNTGGEVQTQINLAGITALQNVVSGTTITLRMYAWGATTTGGTLAFGTGNVNSLALGGSVTSTVNNNANLSNLSLSAGSIDPVFNTDSLSYTAIVTNATNSITVTPFAADAAATITVNGTAVSSGTASGNILLQTGDNTITIVVTSSDGTTTKTYTIIVNRAAAGTPTLQITSALTAFGDVCIGTVSDPGSFTISGNDLDGSGIGLAALEGFSYSETSTGAYTSTLTFSYTGNGFTDKVIYVKFSPVAVQSYNGTIQVSGGSAATISIAATGDGVNFKPSVTTGSSSSVSFSSAEVSGSINTVGCSAITAYGIEYSTASAFPEGSGTQVLGSNLSAGNFTVTLTGLSPNVRYYYKAFAANNAGTTYGTQSAFTCTPLPVKLSAQPTFTFTENFSDIANWGSFFSVGNGANHWGGLSAVPGSGIPNPLVLTASTTSFQGSTFLGSGGVQKGTDQVPPTNSMVLLSTGSPDNTTSAAIDFYMDFTGVNANTLSFDYATLNNSTGNRPGSFRVYWTVNGTTFTEIPDAAVLDFVNNVPITGSKINIALPAAFNNNANARLRFYYHNGSLGTGSGSRPKMSFTNLKITAVATTPCTSPTAPATSLSFGAITDSTIQASFTGTASADNYIVIASINNSLTGGPIDNQIYSVGDNLGDGTVVYSGSSTTFIANGLSASTTYNFFIFPMNSICTNGPLYYTTNTLTGQASTVAGLPACVAPSGQASTLNFTNITTNTIQGNFTATSASGYLVLRSLSATLSTNPADGMYYSPGNTLGNATVIQLNNTTSFSTSNLTPGTEYYFYIFSYNDMACVNGPSYNLNTPLTGSQSTQPLPPCVAPGNQPTDLRLISSNNTISGTFIGVPDADIYIVIRSINPTLSANPVNDIDYTIGDNLGGGVVISNTINNSFATNDLAAGTTYYYFIFAGNRNCLGGTKYSSAAALTSNIATTSAAPYNYYFGSLHAHSDYSDGNQDQLGGTPAVSYDYAMTAQCMDYLGISEHNHFSSPNNPGNEIANYHLGTQQANAFNNTHPNFVALYGMEWGVISGGGHVVVYGNGLSELFGWESGSGAWGPTNNYDVYVPKSTYTGPTGLFKTINDFSAKNTFGTLAHPNITDYNNLSGIPYDAVADQAIAGAAVESGPATSTNQTYSNPGSSLFYLPYYQMMLAKGYHLGPTMDHDNHNTTFGHTTYSRTAILSPTLTEAGLINGMRNMHFYATQDCDTKVDFTLNTKIMGSLDTGRFAPSIVVSLTDASTNTANAKIRLLFGIAGSGSLPVAIDSVIGNTFRYTDMSLPDNTTGYYYIEVTNGSAMVLTSPIWYTRNDASAVLPVKLTSFEAEKKDNIVMITWRTQQEISSKSFVVQRSVDGLTWISIQVVQAAGNSSSPIDYISYDNSPALGYNYYRLKQIDIDGRFIYSEVKKVNFTGTYQVSVSPNPASDYVRITIAKPNAEPVTLQLLDITGKLHQQITTTLPQVQFTLAQYAKGTYILKVISATGSSTQKIVIQ